MKTQQRGWFKGDRHTAKPIRRNPKRKDSSDEPIQGAEIWRTLTRTVEDQQLMFGQKGFCHDATHSARPNKPQNY
jgi:hypothetical protein